MVDTSLPSAVHPTEPGFVRGTKRGMLARIPLLGDAGALWRFFQDADASLLGKAFVLTVVAYIIMPVDLIPDVAPVLGWLDDLGMAFLALAYLSRTLDKYRK